MFLAGRKPNTTLFTMLFFLAFGNKNHGIYRFFVPARSKNTSIYAGFTMLHYVVSISEKKQKSVNSNGLGLLLRCVGGAGRGVY